MQGVMLFLLCSADIPILTSAYIAYKVVCQAHIQGDKKILVGLYFVIYNTSEVYLWHTLNTNVLINACMLAT